ncbi:hypothetical protein ACMG5L_23435 [Escherichia coli]|uniref:hypothetical protein n=1 Tax=Escherichia coli TaxID=562 RepID=UPI0039BFE7A4
MFSFVVAEEQLAKFKERARMAIKEGVVEPGILPACQALLDAPGIAPMWSCEGHDNVTRNVVVDGKTTTKVVCMHPHVIVAVTTEGWSYIDAIGECLRRQSADYIWQICVSRLNDPTREDKSSHMLYWAWGIRSVNYEHRDGGTMEERGQRLNAAILEAIEIVKNKH